MVDRMRLALVIFLFVQWTKGGIVAFNKSVSLNFFLAFNFFLFILLPTELSFSTNYPEATEVTNSISWQDVISLAPAKIANAIFWKDVSFSSPDLNSLVLRYMTDSITHESVEELESFFDRVDKLSNLVVLSILESENQIETVETWKSVAYELLLLNDLFGYICVTNGLDSTALKNIVEIAKNESLDLMIFRHYVGKTKYLGDID